MRNSASTMTSNTCFDLSDKRLNLQTHASNHRNLSENKHLMADKINPIAQLIICYREKQFIRQHARVP